MLELLGGPAAETLRLVERELRLGCWTWDLRTDEMRWSKGYYDLLGLDPGQVTPSFAAILQVTHPEDRKPQAEVERVIRRASAVKRKFRVIRPGGSTAWLFCQIIVLVGSDGIPEKALGVCSDVTESEERQSLLRHVDERYRALVQATDAIVWVAKADGSIREVMNWEHKRSDHEDLVLDRGWIDLVHPDDREQTSRTWQDALRRKASCEVVHRIRQSDGSFTWKRSRGQPLLDDQGHVTEWVGLNIDLEPEPQKVPSESQQITGAQVRAARGLLRWSVRDLAKASGVSRSIIRRLEEIDGPAPTDNAPLSAIEQAFRDAGVEFLFSKTGKPGLRPR
ncbi:PAS domain-containing protein [Bradyrhizobium sp. RDT46]|jgi:PAS domain S-box-containing protein|uniref:PAS domain-containing protein n=1 Tax=Bradyrhizobium sp. RDT46 TaxID=3341829 RepID=UPI0035C6A7B1